MTVDSPRMSPPENQPIGFWTAVTAEAVRHRIRSRLADEVDLTQPEWWVLHHLGAREQRPTTSEMLRTLGPNESDAAIRSAIETLTQRDLIQVSDERWQLTSAGRTRFEEAARIQGELQEERMQGISEADFATTIRVLQRTAANVGADAWHW